MKLLIDESIVIFDLEAESKVEVISKLAKKMHEQERITNLDGYIKAVLEREDSFSTAVGFGVATPHAKTDCAKCASVAFARLKHPIKWDDEDVSIIFQLAVPQKDAGERHLIILASLARKLMHEEFREQIMSATNPKEILELIGEI